MKCPKCEARLVVVRERVAVGVSSINPMGVVQWDWTDAGQTEPIDHLECVNMELDQPHRFAFVIDNHLSTVTITGDW